MFPFANFLRVRSLGFTFETLFVKESQDQNAFIFVCVQVYDDAITR